MKFNKIAFASALSLSLLLAACGSDDNATKTKDKSNENKAPKTEEVASKLVAGGALKDGTYSLSEKDFDDNGWKVQFDMTVKDGKIAESNYNYVNADGKLKSEDKDYQKAMVEKSGTGPADYIPELNDQLVNKQNASQVEVVSGATHSSESFINYAQQLIQAAQKGDTTAIEIDTKAPLKDGEYSLEEKNLDSTGWKTFIKMTVANGKISKVDYNYLNGDGKLKTDDEEYEKTMSEKSGTGPQEYIPELAKSLVEKQNAAEVEVVSGATHSSHAFKMYAAQLINAAQKGDTTPIEVDNRVFEENK
ncbi:extracellular electron transfer flavoprotein PplA [Bacillus andreraoultii]|uniref:extracellular electron transfer flavoprotein PplA n=1 Tax=Bacillus andreraoultii TaxID=1499685 RepID=UPI00053AE461|nr:extracellular electron transfer flavoprotein PplA [Bacillus andreraoultii]